MKRRLRQLLSPPRQLDAREAYRLWAENYPPYAHNLLMQIEERAVLAQLPDVRDRRVLDLACGSGRYANLAAVRGGRALGIDLSFEMLMHAEHDFPRAQGDLGALPLAGECADCIVCGLAVGHVANLYGALREMARILKPNGILVYSDFHAAGKALGWKRTFRAQERTYVVRHFARREADHRAACEKAGLRIERMEAFGVPAEWARTNSQASAFRARWGDQPLALVVRASKEQKTPVPDAP